MTVKTITYDDYLRLCGLLTLAADHRKALTDIEHSARAITGDTPNGTTSDAIWGGYDHTAAELLDILEIAVTPAADRKHTLDELRAMHEGRHE